MSSNPKNINNINNITTTAAAANTANASSARPPPTPAPRSTGSGLPSTSLSLQSLTSASEGFYRRQWKSSPSPAPANAAAAAPRAPSTTPPMLPAPPAYNNSQQQRSVSAPVRPQAMLDRDVVSASAVDQRSSNSPVKAGSLRPPGELGRSPHDRGSNNNNNDTKSKPSPIRAHPDTVSQQQVYRAAIQRGHEREQQQRGMMVVTEEDQREASLTTSFCFQGTEYIVATTTGGDGGGGSGDSGVECYILFSRTQLVLQRLQMPPWHQQQQQQPTPTNSIVALQAHPATGQLVLVWANGWVQTYLPQNTHPQQVSAGRHRWHPGPHVDGALVFYDDDDDVATIMTTTASWDLSLTQDGRFLVAHQNQLAVFDVHADNASTKAATDPTSDNYNSPSSSNNNNNTPAEMLWTTQLPGTIVTAKISGDGHSIAVVLQNNPDDDNDKAATDGVHTFERDWEDGSQETITVNNNSSKKKENTDTNSVAPHPPRPRRSARMARIQSLGILYKPGPFLVHSSPVTRLAFRGYGHATSSSFSSSAQKQQGNDLLLSYCRDDCTARIFGQNHWRPLTEWTTPAETYVDWVRGQAAFSLGDLESVKKTSATTTSTSSVAFDSHNANNNDDKNNNNNNMHASLGKRFHFASIPHHHTTSSASTSAGAWVKANPTGAKMVWCCCWLKW